MLYTGYHIDKFNTVGNIIGCMKQNQRMSFILISFDTKSRSFLDIISIISKYDSLFLGSINVPMNEKGSSALGILLNATNDQLGAITGSLGKMPGIRIKSAVLSEN
jgi:hypothetical protein